MKTNQVNQVVMTEDALDRLDSIALLTGLDGAILDANLAALACYGRTHAEIVGLSIHDIRAPGVDDDIDGQMRKAIERGTVYESLHEHGDGSPFPVEVQSTPISIDGKPALLSLVRDITDSKEAVRELEESESRYRALAETSPLAVIVCHNELGDDRVVLANPACVKLFGASSAEDLIGTSVLDLFDPDSQALIRERIAEVAETVVTVGARVVRLDRTSRDVEVTATSLLDQGVAAVQVVLHDITERKRDEEELRDSAAKLGALFELLPVGVSVLDTENRLAYANPALERITGLTEGALRAGDDRTRTYLDGNGHPLSPDGFASTRAVREGRVVEVEMGIVKDDGQVVWTDVRATPAAISDWRTIVVTADITTRKAAEEAQRRSELLLREVTRSSPSFVYAVDPEGRFIFANRMVEEALGVSEGGLLGKTREAFLPANVVEEHRSNDLRVMESGEPIVTEETNEAADGIHTYLTAKSPLVAPDGKVFGVVGISTDITDRKRAEERLQTAFSSLIKVVGRIAETRDPYTAGHQRRVAELSVAIAEQIGMPDDEVEEIRNAALVHDIGKMSIPAEILSKPGALLPVEFLLVKGHAEAGYEILRAADMPGLLPEIVYQHHERCDGSGYPRALSAEQLLSGAKVLMVADVVEAMASHRPYRVALGLDAALAEIERGAGTLYDADVSKACATVFRERGFVFSDG